MITCGDCSTLLEEAAPPHLQALANNEHVGLMFMFRLCFLKKRQIWTSGFFNIKKEI